MDLASNLATPLVIMLQAAITQTLQMPLTLLALLHLLHKTTQKTHPLPTTQTTQALLPL
jgi:hypothetical protein